MRNWALIGLLVGILFAVLLVWEGAGAAWLMLLFAVVGALVAVTLWIVARMLSGGVDMDRVRSLFSEITRPSQRL